QSSRSRPVQFFNLQLVPVHFTAAEFAGDAQVVHLVGRDAFDSQELGAVGIDGNRVGAGDDLVGHRDFAGAFGAARLQDPRGVGHDQGRAQRHVQFGNAVVQAVAVVVLAVPDIAHQLLH